MASLVTRYQFAKALLDRLGLKPTKRRLWALLAWMQAEGGNAKFNPLNTTHDMPHATDYNSVHVKDYASLSEGVIATAKTLDYGARHSLYGYKAIREALVKNKWASVTLAAVERSEWGTGGLALLCLPLIRTQFTKYCNVPIGQ
jgi:hypothetical protein